MSKQIEKFIESELKKINPEKITKLPKKNEKNIERFHSFQKYC